MSNSNGHGFGLGLLVGGMAGIASYYLFGTEKGAELRKKLVEEFEYAQIKIPQEISQILESQEDPAIPEAKNDTAEAAQNFLAQLKSSVKQKTIKESKSTTKTTSPKKTKHFFTKSKK